jgi:hypothetical protein
MVKLRDIFYFNIKNKQFLPAGVSFLVLFFFEILLWRPKFFYYSLTASLLVLLLAYWQLHLGDIEKKRWIGFLILPPFFIIGLAFYASMLANFSFWDKILIHSLFFFNSIFIYLYLRFSYFYFLKPYIFKEADFKNISSCGNYLSSFLIFSSCYGFFLFLNIQFWLLAPFVLLSLFFLSFQFFWLEKMEAKKNILILLVIPLVLTEIYWALAFLPLNYSVAGLILSIIYFAVVNLTKFHLADNLDKNIIRNYLIFSISILLLILLTARWI